MSPFEDILAHPQRYGEVSPGAVRRGDSIVVCSPTELIYHVVRDISAEDGSFTDSLFEKVSLAAPSEGVVLRVKRLSWLRRITRTLSSMEDGLGVFGRERWRSLPTPGKEHVGQDAMALDVNAIVVSTIVGISADGDVYLVPYYDSNESLYCDARRVRLIRP